MTSIHAHGVTESAFVESHIAKGIFCAILGFPCSVCSFNFYSDCLQFFGTRARVSSRFEDRSLSRKQVGLSSSPRVSDVSLVQLVLSRAQEARCFAHAGCSHVFSLVPVTSMPGPFALEAHSAGISLADGLHAY